MTEFTIGGRTYKIERMRFGEVKAIARINEAPLEMAAETLLDRFARIVEAGTARFGAEAFVFCDESECTAAELTAGATAQLTLAGFIQGEAAAAAL